MVSPSAGGSPAPGLTQGVCVGQEREDRRCRGLIGVFPGPGRQIKNISGARKHSWGDHPGYGTHMFWSVPKCPLSESPSFLPNSTRAAPTHPFLAPLYFSLLPRFTSTRAEKQAVPLLPCPQHHSSALRAAEASDISFSIRARWNSSSIPGKPVSSITWGLPASLR